MINSPHNPTGKVFTDTELARIAELAVEHDLLVVSDEVYERLLFDGRTQTPMASLPGMADRTVTISSAAKTFNCTGWKIGWACGTPELVAGVRSLNSSSPMSAADHFNRRWQWPWTPNSRG